MIPSRAPQLNNSSALQVGTAVPAPVTVRIVQADTTVTTVSPMWDGRDAKGTPSRIRLHCDFGPEASHEAANHGRGFSALVTRTRRELPPWAVGSLLALHFAAPRHTSEVPHSRTLTDSRPGAGAASIAAQPAVHISARDSQWRSPRHTICERRGDPSPPSSTPWREDPPTTALTDGVPEGPEPPSCRLRGVRRLPLIPPGTSHAAWPRIYRRGVVR